MNLLKLSLLLFWSVSAHSASMDYFCVAHTSEGQVAEMGFRFEVFYGKPGQRAIVSLSPTNSQGSLFLVKGQPSEFLTAMQSTFGSGKWAAVIPAQRKDILFYDQDRGSYLDGSGGYRYSLLLSEGDFHKGAEGALKVHGAQ